MCYSLLDSALDSIFQLSFFEYAQRRFLTNGLNVTLLFQTGTRMVQLIFGFSSFCLFVSYVCPASTPRMHAMTRETIVRLYNGPRWKWCEKMPHCNPSWNVAAERGIVNLRWHNPLFRIVSSPSVALAESADLTPLVRCHQLIGTAISIPSQGRIWTYFVNIVLSICRTNSFYLKCFDIFFCILFFSI